MYLDGQFRVCLCFFSTVHIINTSETKFEVTLYTQAVATSVKLSSSAFHLSDQL